MHRAVIVLRHAHFKMSGLPRAMLPEAPQPMPGLRRIEVVPGLPEALHRLRSAAVRGLPGQGVPEMWGEKMRSVHGGVREVWQFLLRGVPWSQRLPPLWGAAMLRHRKLWALLWEDVQRLSCRMFGLRRRGLQRPLPRGLYGLLISRRRRTALRGLSPGLRGM